MKMDNSEEHFIRSLKEKGYQVEKVTVKNDKGDKKDYIRVQGDYMVPTFGALLNSKTKQQESGVLFEIINEAMAVVFHVTVTDTDALRNLKQLLDYMLQFGHDDQDDYIR